MNNQLREGNTMDRYWTTAQLQQDFEVMGFSAGLCVVKRKSDGVVGSLTFHRETDADGRPFRVYTDWQADQ